MDTASTNGKENSTKRKAQAGISVKVCGELEFWFALVKVAAPVLILIIGTYFVVFGSPTGAPTGLQLITDHGGIFPNGQLERRLARTAGAQAGDERPTARGPPVASALGGRPSYGYRLVDAGPHPNRALARRSDSRSTGSAPAVPGQYGGPVPACPETRGDIARACPCGACRTHRP
ncbi:hypothetical protein [Streptomyces sp. NPDC001292]|uniref:hypothetical protein n=1 Tax=Streptomyces sp. NPDC001292 TaxID=3364558 RepID=UPI0036AE36D6